MPNQRRKDKTSFGGFILEDQKAEILKLTKKYGAHQSDVLKAMLIPFLKLPEQNQRKLIRFVMHDMIQ